MTTSRQGAKASSSARKILVTVTAGAESENALQWALENLYKSGDLVHFLHVVPRQPAATSYGAPPIDFLPQMKSKATPDQAQEASTFIKERLLPKCGDMQPAPVVNIVKASLCTSFSFPAQSQPPGLQHAAFVLMPSANACSKHTCEVATYGMPLEANGDAYDGLHLTIAITAISAYHSACRQMWTQILLALLFVKELRL